MKTTTKPRGRDGLTRLEVVVIIGVVLIGGIVLLPMWIKSKVDSKKSPCVSNLREIWLAEKNWRFDHGNRFPWQTPTNEGGTMEYADLADVFRHFQANSNELKTLKLLFCPSDKSRTAARSFARRFDDANVSYFVSLDADEKHPESIVHGDRNITGGESTRFGLRSIQTNTAGWAITNMHMGFGNVVTADGAIYPLSSQGLRDLLAASTNSATSFGLRVAIPRLPTER